MTSRENGRKGVDSYGEVGATYAHQKRTSSMSTCTCGMSFPGLNGWKNKTDRCGSMHGTKLKSHESGRGQISGPQDRRTVVSCTLNVKFF